MNNQTLNFNFKNITYYNPSQNKFPIYICVSIIILSRLSDYIIELILIKMMYLYFIK